MRRRRRRGAMLLGGEDVDPIAFVPNLFDAILVLTVASLVSMSALRARSGARVPKDQETLQGYVDTGMRRAGEGERLGVAYRLADGRLVYVPE